MQDSLRRVYFEPTTKCNFSCHMCFRNSWFDEKFMHMSYETFENALNGIPDSTESVMFAGMGEPLFCPDILKMIEATKKRGFFTELLTNGALLTDEKIAKLMELGLNRLWISLDTFSPKDEETLKGHPSAKDTIETISRINRINTRNMSQHCSERLDIAIAFVASADNVHELANLPSFIARHQITRVNVSNMQTEDNSNVDDLLYKRTIEATPDVDEMPVVNIPYMDFHREDVMRGISGLLGRMNFSLEIGNIPVPRRKNYCRFIEDGMLFIRSDGEVAPCMALLHNGKTALMETNRTVYHHSFGNVNNEKLIDIWNSNDYTAFRRRVMDFSFSPCVHCGHCGLTENNTEDCVGNFKPTCGACLWSEGIFSCP